jgi:hypothetical protein
MRSQLADRDDLDPLGVVVAEFERLAGGAAIPVVVLTDRSRSTAYPVQPWRKARVAIRRVVAERGSSDALSGEVAHEYAHVLRPDTWRYFPVFLLSTERPARRVAGPGC